MIRDIRSLGTPQKKLSLDVSSGYVICKPAFCLIYRIEFIVIAPIRMLTIYNLIFHCSILVPLYDSDTGMCFLCGKGDRNVQFVEVI